MKDSNVNLIQDITALISMVNELEFRDISEAKSHLPLLAYQDFNSEAEILF